MQGKECSRKGPTIRIRVNLQGMDLSRKSRNGISKEQYLQGKEFARNGMTNAKENRVDNAILNGLTEAPDSLITRTLYDLNIKCNLYLQIPFLVNSNPCKFNSLLILACLSSLAFSVPCKFRTLPNRTLSFH